MQKVEVAGIKVAGNNTDNGSENGSIPPHHETESLAGKDW
jgi:hypothetical protein